MSDLAENPADVTEMPESAPQDQELLDDDRPYFVDSVPEKFRDNESGDVRVDDMAKSYLELERKMGTMVKLPGEDADADDWTAFHRAIGVPESADEYEVALESPYITVDNEVNRQFHEAGFTPKQVQLVYKLAEERLLPAVFRMADEFDTKFQENRLVDHYGGAREWEAARDRLTAWGKQNLPADIYAAMSRTADGVLAMEKMMAGGDVSLIPGTMAISGDTQNDLEKLMNSPAYWRDGDPVTVKRVREGFRRLYPE